MLPAAIRCEDKDICCQEEDGTRLSYPEDCQRYVLCLNRKIAQIGSCPRGLHFNQDVGECDYQWRAQCTDPSLDDIVDPCSCSCCAAECQADDLFEDVTTCPPDLEQTTTTASSGTTMMTLPTEIVTDTETSLTDGTTTTKTTRSPTSQPEKTTDSQTTITDDDIDSTSSPPIDPLVPSYCQDTRSDCVNQADGALLPVQGVCTNFIQCNHGCSTEFVCPSGLYFNAKEQMCDYFWNVECTQDEAAADAGGEIAGPSGTTCSDQGVCAKQRDGTMFANPETNGYLVCQCQCPIAMPCDENTKFNEAAQVCDWDTSSTNSIICPDDLVYNSTSNQCVYPENYVPKVQCSSSSTVCQDQPEGAILPVQGACNKFYICNYNCAVEQLCPNNLIFNAAEEYCDYPENVDCEWEYIPPTGPDAGPSGISCESHGRCLGEREGTLLPSLTNCSRYAVCQCECEVEMECAEGLNWDNTLKTCNYATDAGCTL